MESKRFDPSIPTVTDVSYEVSNGREAVIITANKDSMPQGRTPFTNGGGWCRRYTSPKYQSSIVGVNI